MMSRSGVFAYPGDEKAILMNAIQNGAKQAVEKCLKIRPGESVAVITDRKTERLGDAICAAAEKVGANVRKFVMEDFGDRPDDGSNPLKFPKAMDDAMSKAKASVFIASKKAGELASFRQPLTNAAERYNLRHAHMPNFTEQMMGEGMAADYNEIQILCKKVYKIVAEAKKIHVTTPAGTDVTATFDSKYKWIISDGDLKPGHWSNLPDGEVFTSPVGADGVVVIDGIFGDLPRAYEVDLKKHPLRYALKDGRCVKDSVRCDDDLLKKQFEEYTFGTDENSNRIGEFAIGTNIGLKELIGVLLQDEKFPGIHIALGNPYPERTGAGWSSKAHNDGVMRDPTIVVDGKKIMETGKFLI